MKATNPEVLTATDCAEEPFSFWQNPPTAPDNSLVDYRKLMQANPGLEMVLSLGPCPSWMLDIRTQSFVFVSNNIETLLGYKPGVFRQKGLAFLNDLMHPADRKTIWQLTANLWQEVQDLPVSQRKTYRFNRQYRLRQANGNFLNILEQNSVLQTDGAGNITHLLTLLTDISDLRANEGNPVLVKSASTSSKIKVKPEEQKPATKLSKRERQIIKLVAEGYSSKLIADQLFISYHTVNTHRRNIIEKTHSRNASGLVQFAISNRLI